MHGWMMGIGFIVLLMTPCVIAIRTGVEDLKDEDRDDQEVTGRVTARRLKLL
jgi:hypothetical protein